MALRLIQVDAFTNQPFAGNPAAVCLLTEAMPDAWLQQVAAEMNLSETAFLLEEHDGYRLRWFTPTVEVELCGHATLASAHVLWSEGLLAPEQDARFATLSGVLTATRQGDQIELNFPATPAAPVSPPPALLSALGVTPHYTPLYVGKNQFDYLVEVATADEVRQLRPDFAALRAVPGRGVIVTSRGDGHADVDFVSRFFGPNAGIDEDPVTGSAHCTLAPFWAEKLGKEVFFARQLSARGGDLWVARDGARVRIAGHAVTVLRGELVGPVGAA